MDPQVNFKAQEQAVESFISALQELKAMMKSLNDLPITRLKGVEQSLVTPLQDGLKKLGETGSAVVDLFKQIGQRSGEALGSSSKASISKATQQAKQAMKGHYDALGVYVSERQTEQRAREAALDAAFMGARARDRAAELGAEIAHQRDLAEVRRQVAKTLLANLDLMRGASERAQRLTFAQKDMQSAEALAAMRTYYAELERDQVAAIGRQEMLNRLYGKAGALAASDDRGRLLSNPTSGGRSNRAPTMFDDQINAESSALKAHLAELERVADLKARIKQRIESVDVGAKRPTTGRLTLDQRDAQYGESMASMRDFYSAQEAGSKPAKSMISSALEAAAATATLTKEKAKLSDALDRSNPGLKLSAERMRDLHSAARGVASGFNAMWLTWGNIGPLLAGAAVSNAFVKSIQFGSEFETTLTKIAYLGETSAAGVAKLSDEALRLGSTTQYGPREVAEGLKTLTLAGLTASESLQAIKPAMDFATVAEMPLEKASESLLAIGKAFGYTAGELSVVGDVVAKTAASTMSSVTDMTEAFRQSSTIAQMYGVTIQDQSVMLGLLSQIGIKGSAAGTAVRNMYVELMGTTKKAREILEKKLKINIFDEATQSVKPLAVIMGDISKSLANFKAGDALKMLNDLGNERGTKALSAGLKAFVQEAEAAGKSTDTIFKELATKLDESYGFVARAAAGMSLTSANQMKSVGNALEASLIKAFTELQPVIMEASIALREFINSDAFNSGLKAAAEGVVSLGRTLYEHRGVIEAVIKVWASLKAVQIAMALTAPAAAAAIGTVTAAGVASTTAMGRTLGMVNPLIGAVTALAMAYYFLSDGKETATQGDLDKKLLEQSRETLRVEGMKIDQMVKSLNADTERMRLQIKNKGDLKKAEEELQAKELEGAVARMRIGAEDVALTKRRQAARLRADADAMFRDPDGSQSMLALDKLDEARNLEGEANRALSNAESEGLKLKRAVEKNKQQARLLAESATAPALRKTGNETYNPDDRSGRGRRIPAATLQTQLNGELQQITQRYADEVSTIKAAEQNTQTLLKASYDAKLINSGEFYARELQLAAESEAKQLALIEESSAAYAAQQLKDAETLQSRYASTMEKLDGNKTLSDEQRKDAKTKATEDLEAALTKMGDAAVTAWQKFNNDGKSIRDGAVTRMELQAIKARGELRALNQASEDFWLAERMRQKDAASATAVEDALRYASPEQAAYIQAAANENNRLTAEMRKLQEQYEQARVALNGYTNEMLNAEIITEQMKQGETDRIKVLKELKRQLDELSGKAPGMVSDAGSAALLKVQKDARAEFSRGIADALVTGITEGGQAGKKKLRDLLVAELRKPITLAINAVVNASINSLLGLPGGSGGGGVGGLINTGSNIYNMYGGAGSAGAVVGSAGAAATYGTGIGTQQSLMLATQEAGMGTLAGGMGSLGAAMPWILGAMAVVSILSSMDDSGTMHTGGMSQYSALGGLQNSTEHGAFGMGFGGVDKGAATIEMTGGLAKSIVGILDTTASAFGKKGGYSVATGFADDTSKDGAWGGLLIKDGEGNTRVNWNDDRTSRWAPREFADGEAGAKEYALAVAKDVRDVLIEQTPVWADTMLNELGEAPTLEGLAATVAQIHAVHGALTTMGDASAAWASLSDDAIGVLIRSMGGAEATVAGLSSYYANFYTEAERLNVASGQLKDKFGALGKEMPSSVQDFRSMVDAAVAAGDSELAAELIKMSGAFYEVASAAEQARQQVADERAGLEQQLLQAQGKTAELRALELAKLDPSNRALQQRIWALEDEKDAIDAAFSALETSISAQRAVFEVQMAEAQRLKDELQGLFDLLSDSIKDLMTEAMGTAMTAAQGNQFIDNALANARATGYLPDQGDLSDAISAARGGLAANNFSSATDQRLAQLRLANSLTGLQDIAGEQLTAAEQARADAERQIELLEETLEYWKKQIEIADGTFDAVVSVEAAINALREALKPSTTTPGSATGAGGSPAAGPGGFSAGPGGGSSGPAATPGAHSRFGNVYRGSLGVEINDANYVARFDSINEYVNTLSWAPGNIESSVATMAAAAAQYGVSLNEIAISTGYNLGDIETLMAGYNIPRYAIGTNYVPNDGLAYLHQGEAVVPKAYNPAAGGAVGGSDSEEVLALVAAHLAAIRAQNDQMLLHASATARATQEIVSQPLLVEMNP